MCDYHRYGLYSGPCVIVVVAASALVAPSNIYLNL